MYSPSNYIVRPKNNNRYNNTKKICEVEIVINTSIEDAKDVQREAEVIAIPRLFKTDVEIGDIIIIHHNIFRISYNDKGIPLESANYIKDDMFFVEPDLAYMIIRDGIKIAIHDNVFVEPIKEIDSFLGEIEKEHVGILRYGNKELETLGIKAGDRVVYRKGCEYEFIIEGERLYKMATNRILAKV